MPDLGVNLKEPWIMGIPFPAFDLPVLGPVLALAFALGDPLEHGRQGVILHENNPCMLHHLWDCAAICPRLHRRDEDRAEEDEQATHSQGHQATLPHGPPAPEAMEDGTRTRSMRIVHDRVRPETR